SPRRGPGYKRSVPPLHHQPCRDGPRGRDRVCRELHGPGVWAPVAFAGAARVAYPPTGVRDSPWAVRLRVSLVRHANSDAVARGGDAEGAGRGVGDEVVAPRDVAGCRPASGQQRPSAEEGTSRLALRVAHGVDEVVRPGREQTDMRA